MSLLDSRAGGADLRVVEVLDGEHLLRALVVPEEVRVGRGAVGKRSGDAQPGRGKKATLSHLKYSWG